MRQHTQVPSRVTHRFAIGAIAAFAMFSATFAVATALQSPPLPPPVDTPLLEPIAHQAERDHADLLDERIHLHMKRLHSLGI